MCLAASHWRFFAHCTPLSGWRQVRKITIACNEAPNLASPARMGASFGSRKGTMAKQQPATLTITVTAFYDRIAWLMWHGAYQEANALRSLAPWFTPALRLDEDRIDRRVTQYIVDAAANADPVNWI